MYIQRTSRKIPNLPQPLWDFTVKTAPNQLVTVMNAIFVIY